MLVTHGDHALAQDVTQVAFTAAMQQWPALRNLRETERERWLKRVAAHKAVDEFRRNDMAEAHWAGVWERSTPREPDTHREAMSAVALERFWEAVSRLPPQPYRVAVMRWRLDMSERDIAKQMRISEKTVSSHLSRARNELRVRLADHWPIDQENPEGGASS
jgi:RNA polymerase sigma factor (sigma-70 family)